MEVKCKRCDGVYRLRSGKFGVFAGCSNFPQCRSTMKLPAFLQATELTEAEALEAAGLVPPKRFVVFDVETPNSANDRMSAIGVTVVEGGAIVEEFASLVNPETHFDPFNTRLTGITPEAAAQAPAFPALWPKLEPMFSNGLLVAHNAPFDMAVLAKCLGGYGIQWRGSAANACTVRMGRDCYPDLPNHKLNTLCTHLGIQLDHHQASSDSHACALLLLDYLEHGVDVRRFRRVYDFGSVRVSGQVSLPL